MVKLLEVFFALSAFGAVLSELAGNDSATVRLPFTFTSDDPFNLTLDTAATATLLFADGLTYMRKNYACGNGTGQRNSFDPSKSVSYESSGKLIPDGWDETIPRYPTVPYIGLSCEKMVDDVNDDLIGTQATDTFSFDAPLDDASVPLEVPSAGFNLANQSFYPVNARWASDGIFPLAIRELLGTVYGEYALTAVLDEVDGKREVTLFLNGTPSERSSAAPGGVITFGGRDTISCSDKWIQLPWGYVDAGTRVWNLDLHR
ncbi:hypothetical protein AAVH_23273 [Aphelenchoides avenae]|nr:hypothetical protein AAVH_23273 [Aphelenchus avenae]